MCETFVWYYPKNHFEGCSSFYPIEHLYKFFGVKKIKWLAGIDSGAQPVITSPASMANKTFAQALEATVTWTPELREKLQRMVHLSDHEGVCNLREPPSKDDEGQPAFGPELSGPPPEPPKQFWTYPKVDKIYRPPAKCNAEENAIPVN